MSTTPKSGDNGLFRTTCSYKAIHPNELSYNRSDVLEVTIPKHSEQFLGVPYFAKNVHTQKTGIVSLHGLEPFDELSQALLKKLDNSGAELKSKIDNTDELEDTYVQCYNLVESDFLGPPNLCHTLKEVYFVTPILCLRCRDYIWGFGKQGLQCKDCQSCFHLRCAEFSERYDCHNVLNKSIYPTFPATYPVNKHIYEWTSANVVEWMAALNLYTYADVFKSKDIKGGDLIHLDKDKLMNMGIKDDFHQKAILSSIEELQNGQPTTDPSTDCTVASHMGDGITFQTPISTLLSKTSSLVSTNTIPWLKEGRPINEDPHLNDFTAVSTSSAQALAGTSASNYITTSCLTTACSDGTKNSQIPTAAALSNFEYSYHRLTQYSFSQLEKCDKCKKNLRGLMHQGLICSACSFKTHRTCCVNGLPPCYGDALQLTTYNVQQPKRSRFGCALNTLFDVTDKPAPDIVIMCVTELENQMIMSNLDLYITYRYTASSEEVQALKDAFENEFVATTLSNFPAQYITTVLKKFLRELPDPVIPVKFYDAFIEASKQNPDEVSASLMRLVYDLPEHHKSTLRYIMGHLCRICRQRHLRGLRDPPSSLLQVMCHILMRPPWEKIIQVVYNTESHIRIIEMLLFNGDWNEPLPEFDSPPALPPRKLSRLGSAIPSVLSAVAIPSNQLQDAEWYWGNITKDDVREKMQDSPDGTFLVRDASSQVGEYTLTLIKDSSEKLIKISHRNSMYGFTEPYEFSSVVELINYYRKVTLKQYNTILDIKLTYPVSKYREEDEYVTITDLDKLVQNFIEIHTDYIAKTSDHDKMFDLYRKTDQDLILKRQAKVAFREAIAMFDDQIKLQADFRKEAQPHEVKRLGENEMLLRDRLEALHFSKTQLEQELLEQDEKFKCLERDINFHKPNIFNLSKQREKYQRWLLSRGVKETQIKQLMEEGLRAWTNQSKTDSSPHNDESTWLLPECTRVQAETLLAGLPTGTFLIRRRRLADHYALSVCCNDITNHCIIYDSERGYGFAEPYNIYDTLKNLVLHYAQNSLEEHNDSLTTTLRYPVKSTYIQQLRKQPPGTTPPPTSGSTSTSTIQSQADITATPNELGIDIVTQSTNLQISTPNRKI